MVKALKKISEGRELSKFNEYVASALGPVLKSQVIDGIAIKGISLITGSVNSIEHGLGRELVGWLVIGKSANADIWDSQAQNNLKAKTLSLHCSANVTVNLWVF